MFYPRERGPPSRTSNHEKHKSRALTTQASLVNYILTMLLEELDAFW